MSYIKEWEELTIRDNFIFQKVMQNEEICKMFLNKLLKKNIKSIDYPETEKTIELTLKNKSIRLDFYVKDEDGSAFNVEMQTNEDKSAFLPKRARYYGSMIDINALNKGGYYKNLKESYVIFICTFDPFEYDNKIYTFKNTCEEIKGLSLKDETAKIFLYAGGKNGSINKDISRFLDYVEGKKATGKFAKTVEKEVENVKLHKEMRAKYMTWLTALRDEREEGFDEGMEKGMEKGVVNTVIELLRAKQPLTLIEQVSKFSRERILEIGKMNGIALTQ